MGKLTHVVRLPQLNEDLIEILQADIWTSSETEGKILEYYQTTDFPYLGVRYEEMSFYKYKLKKIDNNVTWSYYPLNGNDLLYSENILGTDGILIFRNEKKDETKFFFKRSDTCFFGDNESSIEKSYLNDLAERYNKTSDFNQKLLGFLIDVLTHFNTVSTPNGEKKVHWESCSWCLGRGFLWENEVYQKKCDNCKGKGGYMVYDDTGERYY